ncbi:helix-turn-helix domain-containing protein [Rhodoblastus sp.]|uniref:helix-turn-helix domain-containing protein n=1 Tax=Rhodoblastus sp. TaxID=1962975 RepID=UPI003F9E0151
MALKTRYTVKEAAKALRKTEDTILKLCRSGELKAKNLRPRSDRSDWQIFEDDINAFGADNDNPKPKTQSNLTQPRKSHATQNIVPNSTKTLEELYAEAKLARKPKGKR